MKRFLRYYARRVRFLFFERGVRGGNKFWLIFGGALIAKKTIRNTLGRVSETVTVDQLQPGQSITIHAIPVPKGRKAAKQARKVPSA